jgi:hypothetical protein
MKQVIFSIITLSLFYLSGCMEEKGTYDYREINEIVVDSLVAPDGTSVRYEGSFTVQVGDTLVLSPVISQTLHEGESNLTFCWWAYESTNLDTLSLERNFNWEVNKNPGSYTAVLIVTDTRTGIMTEFDFTLTVVGALTNGVLILSDVDGTANVGFLSASRAFEQDLFEKYNDGAHAGTHPVMIKFSHARNAAWVRQIYILCKDASGGSIVSSLTFEKGKDYKDYFYITPEVINPEAYHVQGSSAWTIWDFIINNGRLHGRQVVSSAYVGQEAKFNPDFDGDYYMAPWKLSGGVFYDNKNYRFFRVTTHVVGNTIIPMDPLLASLNNNTDPAAIAAFDPDNVGLELLYMGSYVSNSAYAIMQEPNNPSSLWRLKFAPGNAYAADVDYPAGLLRYVSYWKEPILPDAYQSETIGEATSYTISKRYPYIFYCKENSLYRYDVEYGINRKIMDTDTIIPNSRLDHVYIQDYFQSTSATYNHRLYAASSEKGQSGKNGSIYSILLNTAGEVASVDTVYRNVVGRVVGMDNKY